MAKIARMKCDQNYDCLNCKHKPDCIDGEPIPKEIDTEEQAKRIIYEKYKRPTSFESSILNCGLGWKGLNSMTTS